MIQKCDKNKLKQHTIPFSKGLSFTGTKKSSEIIEYRSSLEPDAPTISTLLLSETIKENRKKKKILSLCSTSMITENSKIDPQKAKDKVIVLVLF